MAAVAEQKPKVVLHWLNKSRSQRIVWLLEECKGIDYEIKVYNRQPDMLAPPALKEVHPLGKSPVVTIETPNTPKPLVLAESGVITEYLTEYFAKHLQPARYPPGKEGQVGCETEQWLRYRHYMHYAEGSLMTLLMISFVVDNIRSGPQVPWLARPITAIIAGKVDASFVTQNIKLHFDFLEKQLATSPDGGKYLCGKDITAADILLTFPILSAKSRKIDAELYPRVVAYAEALENSEGYKRSVKKIEDISGEPFVLTL